MFICGYFCESLEQSQKISCHTVISLFILATFLLDYVLIFLGQKICWLIFGLTGVTIGFDLPSTNLGKEFEGLRRMNNEGKN